MARFNLNVLTNSGKNVSIIVEGHTITDAIKKTAEYYNLPSHKITLKPR